MADHDPTRDAAPVPHTATHASGSATANFLPELHGTLSHLSDRPAAPPADAPSIPGYEILGELGQGGMGIVYRAREVAFDRDVAIKLLKAHYRPGSPGARRFLEEARITGQLQHPAIPPVHHIGTLADGRPFLAMKLIKGETLADLLDREPYSRGQFVGAFAQVCQALAYAHSRKVIHRDLKPANVMVGSFGEVQVMDWGLAKLLTGEGRQSVVPEATEAEEERTEIRTMREADAATQAGSVLGTPAYMAPEQAQGAVDEIDERSDVFGLGAMLCAILTGKPPYSGPSTEAIRLKALRGETADCFVRLDGCGADPELVAICKRCLATDRMARPCDAGEVARAVLAHLAAVEERARQAELDRVRAEEQRKRRRVWDAKTGAELLVLKGHTGWLRWACFDPDGTRIVTAGWDGTAKVWDARTGAEQLTLKGHMSTVSPACFSPDGSRIVTGSADRTVKVWDAKTGAEMLTLRGYGQVNSPCFSPDGSRVLAGAAVGYVNLWDARTGA